MSNMLDNELSPSPGKSHLRDISLPSRPSTPVETCITMEPPYGSLLFRLILILSGLLSVVLAQGPPIPNTLPEHEEVAAAADYYVKHLPGLDDFEDAVPLMHAG